MILKNKKIIFAVCALALFGAVCACVAAFAFSKDGGDADTNAVADAEESVNILLLGTDREAGLCDVMMLVNLDFSADRATVLQIPRDTYAAYTDKSYKKLNGAYISLGGAKKTAKFLGDAMGISVDHYACIDLDTLCRIVDAVGGVDVNAPCDMYYRDPEQELDIAIKKGTNHLDGAAAERFVRFRSSYATGDLGRIDAQKLFLASLFDKIVGSFSPALALRLAGAVENVETDMSVSDMLSLGTKALGMKRSRVTLLTLPGEEVTATESGASYYVLSAPATAEITEKFFARKDRFDSGKVFLNTRYESFERIYGEYAEYRATTIDDLSQNGINIPTKP